MNLQEGVYRYYEGKGEVWREVEWFFDVMRCHAQGGGMPVPSGQELSKLEFDIRKMLRAGLEVGYRLQAVTSDSPRSRVPQSDVPSTQQLRRPPGLP